MDPILQWVVGQTGLAGIAAFAIWVNYKLSEQRVEDAKTSAVRIQEKDAEILRLEKANHATTQQMYSDTRNALNNVSAAITTLTVAVEKLVVLSEPDAPAHPPRRRNQRTLEPKV